MKPLTWTAAALLALSVTLAHAQEKTELKTQNDKLSYSIGVNIGNSLKKEGLKISPNIVAQAIHDVFSDAKLRLTDEQMQETMMTAQKEMMAQQSAAGEKNKAAGEKFLTENKKRKEVVTLPKGLQYEILKKGAGAKPKAEDTVKVHYRGTLIDGTEFDSSLKRGEPAVFPVTGVIKGWTEALQLMPVGSKWKLYIPSELAYGDKSPGGGIGPNSTLVFEVELLGIEKGDGK